MIKIKVFSPFCSNEHAIMRFIEVNEFEKDPDFNKTYSFTSEEDYTHAIIMNKAMPQLKIPKRNVIGLAFEPREFLNITQHFYDYAQRYIGMYFIGNSSGLGNPFVSHFGYMWHTLFNDNLKQKTKRMSLMVSDKKMAPGHLYRHTLAKRILSDNLDIDIYGRGCKILSESYPNDKRLKGEFKSHKEMLEDYEYHIAIENFRNPDYFSEKLMDPLVCNTRPLYIGCEKHKKYFGDMAIPLTGDADKDIEIIKEYLKKPRENDIDLKKVKETVSLKKIINLFLKQHK